MSQDWGKMLVMADQNKWPENVPGKYYVNENCIASDFCVAVAPANFKMDESGHAYVFKQPETPEEERQCQEALAGCPVSAICEDRQ
ncbi:MAG TPA: ferredoxin [Bryobacteraceae bacterium]|nr:ferredoxin [Bryobacteraceae bacterium]